MTQKTKKQIRDEIMSAMTTQSWDRPGLTLYVDNMLCQLCPELEQQVPDKSVCTDTVLFEGDKRAHLQVVAATRDGKAPYRYVVETENETYDSEDNDGDVYDDQATCLKVAFQAAQDMIQDTLA